jgi:hypothetical protein
MPARRLLLLDATRLTAYQWHLGSTQHEADFPPDETGLAAFGEYLQGHRSSLFYLLADVAEEGFQIEEVPYVHGRDRDSLIKRKLAQYYYGTPLATAVSLGRSSEGRRDERILFSGLSGYSQFEPWLLTMREVETQLVGVYAMPMAVADAVARQVRDVGQALVVSVTRAGLRQTFFDRGQLRFSRLSQIASNSIDEVSVTCATESEKTVQYLAGQRMIARDAPLPTLILAHPSDFAAIGNRCRNTEKSNFQFLDLVALSKQHGLTRPPADSHAEELLLHTLVRQTPRQQFAPPEDRHFYRLWQVRFGLRAAGLGILALCLLATMNEALKVYNLSERQSILKAQIEIGNRRYDSILQTLPKIPISTENLRAVTDRSDLLARRSPGLEPALQQLSRGLARVPKVELTQLEWQLANRADAGRGAKETQADKSSGDGSYVLLDVQAQLPLAMVSDHRAQIDTVNSLIEALKTDRVEARVVTLPFETESGKLLKSGAESATQIEPPKFAFRMVQKL